MKNIHYDLSSLDLGIHEARDLAQNRPFCTALRTRSGAIGVVYYYINNIRLLAIIFCTVQTVNYTVMDLVVVFALFVFILLLLCFCVATVFR